MPSDELSYQRRNREGSFCSIPAGESIEDGLYRSAVFPGLWLDLVALLEGDMRQLRAVGDLGWPRPNMPGSSRD